MRRDAPQLAMAVCFVVVASIAVAQGPRGGFGPPGMPMGPPGGALAMLQIPEVQTELSLTDEQKNGVSKLLDEQRMAMEGSFRGLDPRVLQSASQREREKLLAAMREKMTAIEQRAGEQLKTLLEASQLKRYEQLRLQRDALAALDRDDVARQLQLSDAQRAKIRRLQPAASFGPPRPNPRALASALEVLSPEQQAQWAELTGEKFAFPEPNFGPPGMGPQGMGPPGGEERKLLDKYDTNQDGKLDAQERKAAHAAAAKGAGLLRSRPLGPGMFGGSRYEPTKPGARVSPEEVATFPDAGLYDTRVLRTLFLTFENDDWEAELADFHNTDVEVPATLVVDGKRYEEVGVHFRGMSSYAMVPAGSKRSLNVSLDHGDRKQRLYGYKTLNLLNGHEDPSLMRTVLYSEIARQHIAAPKANFVRVVINGEDWGVYVSAQQFDKIFVSENFASPKGTRWKVPGSPMGGGGLEYLGDDIADYRRRYEIKSDDHDQAWRKLILLCKTLAQTPPDELEQALKPMLDIDGALWFLALDNALINNDGYWVRASDFHLFLDGRGKFHLVPHDVNETFRAPMGPGMFDPFGGARGESSGNRLDLDPLIGLDDRAKPLRSKLLAVGSLQQRYLRAVREIAEQSLDWNELGPRVAQHRALIADAVAADTRKLASLEAFERATAQDSEASSHASESLRAFADGRRAALLSHPAIKSLVKP